MTGERCGAQRFEGLTSSQSSPPRDNPTHPSKDADAVHLRLLPPTRHAQSRRAYHERWRIPARELSAATLRRVRPQPRPVAVAHFQVWIAPRRFANYKVTRSGRAVPWSDYEVPPATTRARPDRIVAKDVETCRSSHLANDLRERLRRRLLRANVLSLRRIHAQM